VSGGIGSEAQQMQQVPRELATRWRLRHAACLGTRLSSRWRAERGPGNVVVKHLGAQALPDWPLVLPVYWAWLFLGVKDLLARSYGSAGGPRPVDLSWQIRQLRRRSDLLTTRIGEKYTDDA
jgi:hypothetical protein